VCVRAPNMCKEIGVKLDMEHVYVRVPKSIETSQDGRVTIFWNLFFFYFIYFFFI
jgi:hypothetical protein